MSDASTGIEPGTDGQGQAEPADGLFTQEQVNSILAEQKRLISAKYSDYKQLQADSKRLREIEEANKSELQREQEARAAAEAELAGLKAQAEIERIKKDVAEKSGIPAEALRGTTEEEIEAHAEQLRALIPETPSTPIVRSDGKHPRTSKSGDAKSVFAEFVKSL